MEREHEVPQWCRRGEFSCLAGLDPTPDAARRGSEEATGGLDPGARWYGEWFAAMLSEATAEKLADSGVAVVECPYVSGCGSRQEEATRHKVKAFAAAAQARGLRVVGCLQGHSVSRESFFAEMPQARQWCQKDSQGSDRHHLDLYWRTELCYRHPDFRQYLKELCTSARQEAGLDGVRLAGDLDSGCHCELCQRAFCEWLEHHYDENRRRELFGLTTFAAVRIPPSRPERRDPLFAAWVRFRSQSLAELYRELNAHCKSLSPDFALGGSPGFARNLAMAIACGVDPRQLFCHLDFVGAENDRLPRYVRELGGVVSNLEAYKLAAAAGATVWPAQWSIDPDTERQALPATQPAAELALAEPLGCGGHGLGFAWGLSPDDEGRSAVYQRPYLLTALWKYATWLKEHRFLYQGAVSVAPVGLFRSFVSCELDFADTFASLQGMIQVLLRERFPFEFVLDGELERIFNYPILVVANQTCLSDEELDALTRYAQDPTKFLLVTGKTGLRDEWLRPRRKDDLLPLLEAPGSWWIRGKPEEMEAATVALPERHTYFAPHLPRNLNQMRPVLSQAARAAGHSNISLRHLLTLARSLSAQSPGPREELRGEGAVAFDVYQLPDNRRVAHVVNYRNDAELAGLELVVFRRPGTQVAACAYSPQFEAPLELPPSAPSRPLEGEMSFPLSSFRTYLAVTLEDRRP